MSTRCICPARGVRELRGDHRRCRGRSAAYVKGSQQQRDGDVHLAVGVAGLSCGSPGVADWFVDVVDVMGASPEPTCGLMGQPCPVWVITPNPLMLRANTLRSVTKTPFESLRPKGFWPDQEHSNAWVPGRFIGGTTMIIGPLVWFAGLLVRYLAVHVADLTPEQRARFDAQNFAAPRELAAYAQEPALVTAGYALFAGGTILLFPAVLTFARIVAARCPRLAWWGGTIFGASLFARLYYSGIDLTAFQLVDTLGLQQATEVVLESYAELSYGLWRIPVTGALGALVGIVLLTIGAFRSGTIGLGRGVLLLSFGWVFMGVLKQSDLIFGVLGGGVAICVVFIPLGIAVLRDRIRPLHTTATPMTDTTPIRTTPIAW